MTDQLTICVAPILLLHSSVGRLTDKVIIIILSHNILK